MHKTEASWEIKAQGALTCLGQSAVLCPTPNLGRSRGGASWKRSWRWSWSLQSCVCCIAQGLPRSTRGAEPSVGRGGQEPDGASLPAHGGAGRPSSPLAACPAQAPVTRASLLFYLMHRVLQALTPLFCMLRASKSRARRQMSLSRSKYHKYILQLCRRCRGLVPPDPQRGTVTFLPCASMLPWTEPKSPGLFFFFSLCHRIALQPNELTSAGVSAALLPRAPSIGGVRYPSLCAGGERGELRRVEISHRRLCWGQTCCKFYKKNTLQTRSPTLVRMEPLINSLETGRAREPIPPSLSLLVLHQAFRIWGSL